MSIGIFASINQRLDARLCYGCRRVWFRVNSFSADVTASVVQDTKIQKHAG